MSTLSNGMGCLLEEGRNKNLVLVTLILFGHCMRDSLLEICSSVKSCHKRVHPILSIAELKTLKSAPC